MGCGTSAVSPVRKNKNNGSPSAYTSVGTSLEDDMSVLSVCTPSSMQSGLTSQYSSGRKWASDDLQSCTPTIAESVADMTDFQSMTTSRTSGCGRSSGAHSEPLGSIVTHIDNRPHPLSPTAPETALEDREGHNFGECQRLFGLGEALDARVGHSDQQRTRAGSPSSDQTHLIRCVCGPEPLMQAS